MAKIRHRFTRKVIMEVEVPPRTDGFGRYLASFSAQDREEGKLPPDLDKSDLSGRDLAEADLKGASLINTNLTRAVLTNADLEDAYLVESDLTDASLVNANLKNAGLHYAILTGTDLTGVDLTGAKYSSTTVWPEDFSPEKHGAIYIDTENFLAKHVQDHSNASTGTDE